MEDKSKQRCHECGADKFQLDFYKKVDKRTGYVRWDRTCKSCRRKQRVELYRDKNLNEPSDTVARSKRIIEPESLTAPVEKTERSESDTHIRHVNDLDFNDMEEFYDKKLSFNERHEIVKRFNEFVAILREGYGEITGSDVFIRKD